MTNQEALEQLEYAKGIINRQGKDYLDERDFPVLECAIEALKKQIPKKPLRSAAFWNKSIVKLYCPICKNFLGHENKRSGSITKEFGDYCDCGQKISWWR